jgi:hypothetical protein
MGAPIDRTTPFTDGSQYTAAEVEFILAIDRWKTEHHDPFPTWCEVLGVLGALGYAKNEGEGVSPTNR